MKKNIVIFGGSGLIGKTLIQSSQLKKYLLFNVDLSIKKKISLITNVMFKCKTSRK